MESALTTSAGRPAAVRCWASATARRDLPTAVGPTSTTTVIGPVWPTTVGRASPGMGGAERSAYGGAPQTEEAAMGIFDKAKDALSEHSEHVDKGIDARRPDR